VVDLTDRSEFVTYVAVRADLELTAGQILRAGLEAIDTIEDDDARSNARQSKVVLVRPASKADLDEAIADAVCLGWEVAAARDAEDETLAVAFAPADPGAYPLLDALEGQ
jgi:hypothetical protein